MALQSISVSHLGLAASLGLKWVKVLLEVKWPANLVNPLSATGANVHQVPMLIGMYGIERVSHECGGLHYNLPLQIQWSVHVAINSLEKPMKMIISTQP